MEVRISSGKHRGRPGKFGLWIRKNILTYDVRFYTSCRYEIKGENQNDTNKLFGIGYFPSHHKESARFGWRYNKETDKIKLSAYCYVRGQRVIEELIEVPFLRWFRLELVVFVDEYYFIVTDTSQDWNMLAKAHIQKSHTKKLSYPLWVYFGGNEVAKKDMTLELKKINAK